MRQHQNMKRHDVEYSVSDWLLLRLQQRTTIGITASTSSNLRPCYFGPYQVVEWIGAIAYRLHLPPKARIHDVFHVAFLKYHGDPPASIVSMLAILRGRVVPTPSQVVRARLNRGQWQLLAHWEGRTVTDATWEPITEFKERYPTFQLADKLFVGEEGSVVYFFVDQWLGCRGSFGKRAIRKDF
jgi:hypothetical protein